MFWQRFKKKISDEFNLKKQADELGLKVWQTPSFLFIAMGLVIIIAIGGVYFVSKNYDSPEILVISESAVVAVLFSIGNLIISSVDQLARANKMKTEFVSVASHQLKTPIAEINWQIELLLSKFPGGLSEKQQLLIGQIAHSSQKMARLVNDLLDVAHIDQGKLALAKEDVDLCVIVKEAIVNQHPFAISAGVEIKSFCPLASPNVSVDRKRVGVVLDNLLSNAIKYTKREGTVEIFLETKENTVQVHIRDDGVGIPSREQHDIFKKFFRSNNAMKNNTDGTGLGLYIAKNIIEQSGGKLWFQSIENIGSDFFFSLPTIKKVT
ncbi:MAG: HAMP domain-containing histidine kinase [Candidatus Moranbacteria bacterium]|nr:HAMP domain-containing histidine kinase [Candidatus Moranbacteria bacterium]